MAGHGEGEGRLARELQHGVVLAARLRVTVVSTADTAASAPSVVVGGRRHPSEGSDPGFLRSGILILLALELGVAAAVLAAARPAALAGVGVQEALAATCGAVAVQSTVLPRSTRRSDATI